MLWKVAYYLLYPLFKIFFRLEIKGRENLPEGGALLVSNHKSYLDPIVLGLATKRPVSFMAKFELFQYPLFSALIKALYAFPVKRGEIDRRALREAIRRVKEGFLIGIFPEGTRSRSDEIGEFKPGLVLLVKLTEVPVIPAAVIGTEKVLRRKWLFPCLSKIKVIIGEGLHFEADKVVSEEVIKTVRDKVVQLYREEKWKS